MVAKAKGTIVEQRGALKSSPTQVEETNPDENQMSGSENRENLQGESTPDERYAKISEAAYYRAERRGFAPGSEDNDWLDAENEIDGA
jgi:hypothetical protein